MPASGCRDVLGVAARVRRRAVHRLRHRRGGGDAGLGGAGRARAADRRQRRLRRPHAPHRRAPIASRPRCCATTSPRRCRRPTWPGRCASTRRSATSRSSTTRRPPGLLNPVEAVADVAAAAGRRVDRGRDEQPVRRAARRRPRGHRLRDGQRQQVPAGHPRHLVRAGPPRGAGGAEGPARPAASTWTCSITGRRRSRTTRRSRRPCRCCTPCARRCWSWRRRAWPRASRATPRTAACCGAGWPAWASRSWCRRAPARTSSRPSGSCRGVTYEALHDAMKRRGYIIYAGQGEIRTYAFRVSNMGTLTPKDMQARGGGLRGVPCRADGLTAA